MTNVEVLTGLELDVLVAEKVMGWTKVTYPCEAGRSHYKEHRDGHDCCPRFSESIDPAWSIVTKLTDEGHDVQIHVVVGGATQVMIAGMMVRIVTGFDRSDTTPLAICRAALKHMAQKR